MNEYSGQELLYLCLEVVNSPADNQILVVAGIMSLNIYTFDTVFATRHNGGGPLFQPSNKRYLGKQTRRKEAVICPEVKGNNELF